MADISQVNMEEMSREYSEEEVARLMNEIMKNNVMMLKLQKKQQSCKKWKKKRKEDRQR